MSKETLSDAEKNEALEIARFVVENGRVESIDGELNPDSLETEVEFEASERGHKDADAAEMGKYAAKK